MNSFTAVPTNLPAPLGGNLPRNCATSDMSADGPLGMGWFYPDHGPTVYRDVAGSTPIKLSTQAVGSTVYCNAQALGASPFRGGPTHSGETYALTRLS